MIKECFCCFLVKLRSPQKTIPHWPMAHKLGTTGLRNLNKLKMLKLTDKRKINIFFSFFVHLKKKRLNEDILSSRFKNNHVSQK